MAKFYWVFDGFVEPDHGQEYRGPEHGLESPPIREELKAHLERELQKVKQRAADHPAASAPTPRIFE